MNNTSFRSTLALCAIVLSFGVSIADARGQGTNARNPLNPARAGSQPLIVEAPIRRIEPLDADWRFHLADAEGPQSPDFDDRRWRVVRLPHDWSIEGSFDRANATGRGGGFLPAGIGWYRKSFLLPETDSARRVLVEFDGIMANSDVWINGALLGHRPNGTVGLRYDLSGHVNFGSGHPNILTVRADNSAQPASRWYTGAGIYRHARIIVLDAVQVVPSTMFVRTVYATPARATIHVSYRVGNLSSRERTLTVNTSLAAPTGGARQHARTVIQLRPGMSAPVEADFSAVSPALWSLERPQLCSVSAEVVVDHKVVDSQTISCGIRDARFEADSGFWLNGANLKIKGVCLHQDGGAFGVAVPLAIWERRLTLLKRAGVNAVRTCHNPPAPEFLDLCDRMGLLVLDEMFDCWTVGKTQADYHLYFDKWAVTDLTDAILRDRNHPSIIAYSIGNEIRDTPNSEAAKQTLVRLRDAAHSVDPSRPVTQALFRPNASHDYDNGLADLLDVIGQNYRERELLAAHRARPERRILGTENGHDRAAWLLLRDNPPFAGQFLWTGFDYLGESRGWPAVGQEYGLFDRTGVRRPVGAERTSWWSSVPMVAIARRLAPAIATPTDPGYESNAPVRRQVLFEDWSPTREDAHEEAVEVYSNCASVELFLNDRSLGAQSLHADASPRSWRVPFAAGTLRAVGKNGGALAAVVELKTAGLPARVLLTADHGATSLTQDTILVVAAVVADSGGTPCPHAADPVTFAVTGPAEIVAVDNGDILSHEPFQARVRHAYEGRCVAYVRITGKSGPITISATAPRLKAADLVLRQARANATR